MNQNQVTPPNSLVQDYRVPLNESDMDIWEPPFERWMKLADELLTGWVCVNASVPARRAVKFAAREY